MGKAPGWGEGGLSLVDTLAREFHWRYEFLADRAGWNVRAGRPANGTSGVPWEDLPDENRLLMRMVIMDLISARVITPGAAWDDGAPLGLFTRLSPEEQAGPGPK